MEIGYKRENSADEYYFTKDEAIAMAKKICADLERSDGFNDAMMQRIQWGNDATDSLGTTDVTDATDAMEGNGAMMQRMQWRATGRASKRLVRGEPMNTSNV